LLTIGSRTLNQKSWHWNFQIHNK